MSQDVDAIFYNLTELHELSIKLLGDLDECIEMSGEIGGNSNVPQVGVIFEDIAEVIIKNKKRGSVVQTVNFYNFQTFYFDISYLVKFDQTRCPSNVTY